MTALARGSAQAEGAAVGLGSPSQSHAGSRVVQVSCCLLGGRSLHWRLAVVGGCRVESNTPSGPEGRVRVGEEGQSGRLSL